MNIEEIEAELEQIANPSPELQKQVGDLFTFAEAQQQHHDKATAWLYGQWCGIFLLMRNAEHMNNRQHMMVAEQVLAIATLLHRLDLPCAGEYLAVAMAMHEVTVRINELADMREARNNPVQ